MAQRLEAVGQLELVALAAAEELDPASGPRRRPTRSRPACSPARARSVPAPGRTRAGGRTCRPRARRSSGTRRPAVEPQRHDARDVERGQPLEHGAVEPHATSATRSPTRPAGRPSAARAGGRPPRVPSPVRGRPRDRDLEPAEGRELAPPPPVQAAGLRRGPRLETASQLGRRSSTGASTRAITCRRPGPSADKQYT